MVIVRHAESERNIWKEIATAKRKLVYGGQVRDMDVPLTANVDRQATTTGQPLVLNFRLTGVYLTLQANHGDHPVND